MVVGFISVTCELDSNLLQEVDLSPFDGLSRQITDADAAAQPDSEGQQVSCPTHTHTPTLSLSTDTIFDAAPCFAAQQQEPAGTGSGSSPDEAALFQIRLFVVDKEHEMR